MCVAVYLTNQGTFKDLGTINININEWHHKMFQGNYFHAHQSYYPRHVSRVTSYYICKGMALCVNLQFLITLKMGYVYLRN